MAGTLPGVGVDSRRMRHHRRHDDPRLFREPPSLSERLQRSTTVTMAETALLARQRLDLKLARFRSSSRSNKQGSKGSRESRNSRGSKMEARPWEVQASNCSKSEEETCSVCLKDLEGEQQAMEFSCSHKYHSNCLMSWLASHPHCPAPTCCNPVPS